MEKVLNLMRIWWMEMSLFMIRVREWLRERIRETACGLRQKGMVAEPGIDGILVTVGLCIIALLLCVVMKNSLSEFIKSIVSSMTKEATDILSGTRV